MYPVIKRTADILFSLLLLIGFSPALLIIALGIYLQDRGPALFRHDRIGRDGEAFRFYKFRTMPVATPIVESHRSNELKVTPFGRFLRRTNLDELPQFYNVLIGDMSLIGPRPPIPSQKDLIELRSLNGAINLRPGLTGLAQINSYDGMPASEKARFDGEYAQNFSLAQDLRIFIRSFVYLFKKPPVY